MPTDQLLHKKAVFRIVIPKINYWATCSWIFHSFFPNLSCTNLKCGTKHQTIGVHVTFSYINSVCSQLFLIEYIAMYQNPKSGTGTLQSNLSNEMTIFQQARCFANSWGICVVISLVWFK